MPWPKLRFGNFKREIAACKATIKPGELLILWEKGSFVIAIPSFGRELKDLRIKIFEVFFELKKKWQVETFVFFYHSYCLIEILQVVLIHRQMS